MAVNATSIKLLFTEFADQPDAKIEFAIAEAGLHVDTSSTSSWGDAANIALSYLAAHYLAASIRRASAGSVQAIASERIGEISITYQAEQATSPSAGDFSSTDYGERYLSLCASNFPAIAII